MMTQNENMTRYHEPDSSVTIISSTTTLEQEEEGVGKMPQAPSLDSEKSENAPWKETSTDVKAAAIEVDNEYDDGHDGVPIDHGWAWMTVIALFFNLFIMVGYVKAMGVLFVEFLAIYRASTTLTTMLMGAMSFAYSITSLLTMQVVVTRLDTRKTIILGGFLTSAGIILSYFADSVEYLICFQGVILGIGHGLINGPGMVLIGEYFRKYRGIATSIAICGVSVGSSVFPPFVDYLLQEYTLRDTFLILGALSLNLIAGGMLSRPISLYRKLHAKKLLLHGRRTGESHSRKHFQVDESHSRKMILLEDKTDESDAKERLLEHQACEFFNKESNHGGTFCKEIRELKHACRQTSNLVTKSLDHLPNEGFLQTRLPRRERTFSDSMDCRRKVDHYKRRTCKNLDAVSKSNLLLLSCSPEIGAISIADLRSVDHSLDTGVTTSSGHDRTINHESTLENVVYTNRKHLMNGNDNTRTEPGTNSNIRSMDRGTNSNIRSKDRELDACINPDVANTDCNCTHPKHSNDKSGSQSCSNFDISKGNAECDTNVNSEGLLTNGGIEAYTTPESNALNTEDDARISLTKRHLDGCVQDDANHSISNSQTGYSLCHRILHLLRKPLTVFDFSVFKNPLFTMVVFAAIFSMQTLTNLTYFPALAIENGISKSESALLLTITGSLDLLSKLACGWFADLGVIRIHHLQVIGLCISSTPSLFVSMYTSYPLMVGYAVIQGLFGGVYRSLYSLVLIDFVGLENMGKAFGIFQLVHASTGLAHPIIGALRDLTGSYSASFQYTAICGFVGAGILLLEKWVRRRKEKMRDS